MFPYLGNIIIFEKIFDMKKFDVFFLEPAKEFLDNLDEKSRQKVLFKIWKSRAVSDPRLFKKLSGEIWEFRTLFNRIQYRLFAFWDDSETNTRLVIATHGIVKKSKKTPKKEIERADKLRIEYINNLKTNKL